MQYEKEIQLCCCSAAKPLLLVGRSELKEHKSPSQISASGGNGAPFFLGINWNIYFQGLLVFGHLNSSESANPVDLQFFVCD